MVDQRGTGKSGALDCAALERPGAEPIDVRTATCADQLGPARSHYTTSDSIDDLEAVGRTARLRRLSQAFGLDGLDREILVVALAPDLDPRFEKLYGYLHDDVTRKRPSIGLAIELTGRGFGDSEGDASYLDPMTQVADWSAAVTYLEPRPEIDRGPIGAFGSGGTGGRNALYAAGLDPRITAVVSQVPAPARRA